jgi:hypothetical protein
MNYLYKEKIEDIKMGNLCATEREKDEDWGVVKDVKIEEPEPQSENHFVVFEKNQKLINIIDDYLFS